MRLNGVFITIAVVAALLLFLYVMERGNQENSEPCPLTQEVRLLRLAVEDFDLPEPEPDPAMEETVSRMDDWLDTWEVELGK